MQLYAVVFEDFSVFLNNKIKTMIYARNFTRFILFKELYNWIDKNAYLYPYRPR